MDVSAILQALLGAGAPTACPGTSNAAAALEASFAALFAAAAGTGQKAGEAPHPAVDQPADDHSPAAADDQAPALAAAAVAAFLPPPAVPSSVPVATATATTAAPPVGEDAAPVVRTRGAATAAGTPVAPCASGAVPPAAQPPATASSTDVSPTATGDVAAPADAPTADPSTATAAAKPAGESPTGVPEKPDRVPATASAPRSAAAEHPRASHPTATAAGEPDVSSPDAKVASGRPAVAATENAGVPAPTRDQDGEAVVGPVERAADGPHRGADRPAAAGANGHAAAAVQSAAPGSDTDTGGREPGRRGTDGAVVVAAARRLGEVSEPKRSGSGADSSGPSSLPPPAPARETVHTETTAPEPSAGRPGAEHDVERLMRLDQMRPVRLRDGGDMRLEVAPEGLGRVEVRVEVRADAVHAALYAQQDHARDALIAHRPALEAALGRSQLRLETFSVGLAQHDLGDQSRQGAHAEPARDETPTRTAARPAPAPAAAPVTPVEPAASRGLSLRA